MKAGSQSHHQFTQAQVQQLLQGKWYHSLQLPGGQITPGLIPIDVLEQRLAYFDLPNDLRGARVLDIGAWDGYYSFAMERRGASVVALDLVPVANFRYAHAALNSQVDYRTGNIERLSPSSLGKFDIILCFGVLYHLKHPLLALEKIAAMADGIVCLESYVTENDPPYATRAACEFYELDELGGQFDNWTGPNIACFLAWCRTVGFCDVTLRQVVDCRAHIQATKTKRFPPPAHSERPALGNIHNSVTLSQDFEPDGDDYIGAWFSYPHPLAKADLFATVGTYTVPAVHLQSHPPNSYHATFKLPYGLEKGPHRFVLSSNLFPESNPRILLLGMDFAERNEYHRAHASSTNNPTVRIVQVTDGITWEFDIVHRNRGSHISVWLDGYSLELSRQDIVLHVADEQAIPNFISGFDQNGWIQLNFQLPAQLAAGTYWLSLQGPFGSTQPRQVTLL